ncbi:Zinc finger, CW-type [Sesbania bispinosa]|nr:Zinc finger, CW-type [Sesbania bispinosa]
MLCVEFNDVSVHMNRHDITKSKDNKRNGLLLEKKKTGTFGSKCKGLLLNSQGGLKLKLTVEEAQDLLHPSPTVKPTSEVIEGIEFEEYEEPPVMGKKGIFLTRSNGINEQWAQCDNCSKWRKLPVDILLPPKWTCVENIWDPSRSTCSAPNEMNPEELDHVTKMIKG